MSEFTMDEYRNMDKYLSKFTRCGLAKFTLMIVTCAVTGGKFFPSVWNMIDFGYLFTSGHFPPPKGGGKASVQSKNHCFLPPRGGENNGLLNRYNFG